MVNKILHGDSLDLLKDMDDEYVVIAQTRIKAHEPEQKQHDFF